MTARVLRFQRRFHAGDPALPAVVLHRGRQWEAWRIDPLDGGRGWKSVHDRDGKQVEVRLFSEAEAAMDKRREFVAEINAQLACGWSLQWCDGGTR